MTGIAVGWLAGLLGIGGGLIVVPVLVWLFIEKLDIALSLAMPMAIATSLSTIVFTGFSSARAHYQLGNLDRSLIIFCGSGVALGAVFGAIVASKMSGEVLSYIFAGLVLLVALYMLFGKIRHRDHQPGSALLSAIGTGAGGLSALMGIGGGAILVPWLSWFGVPIRKAIGCASACGLVVAIFGAAGFIYTGLTLTTRPDFSVGYIYWPATISIAATSVMFAPMGAKFGQKLDTAKLKKIFAVFLILVSIRMIWGIS
ncbi:sulfite exporter TauE/SafE family protein [Alteromonas sediminis]|uniref:sulfite exporter TauE/SafE family protein n=1 Tax=Alteromonas sediminis TaxID=2259342 RepID=UPI0030B806DC